MRNRDVVVREFIVLFAILLAFGVVAVCAASVAAADSSTTPLAVGFGVFFIALPGVVGLVVGDQARTWWWRVVRGLAQWASHSWNRAALLVVGTISVISVSVCLGPQRLFDVHACLSETSHVRMKTWHIAQLKGDQNATLWSPLRAPTPVDEQIHAVKWNDGRLTLTDAVCPPDPAANRDCLDLKCPADVQTLPDLFVSANEDLVKVFKLADAGCVMSVVTAPAGTGKSFIAKHLATRGRVERLALGDGAVSKLSGPNEDALTDSKNNSYGKRHRVPEDFLRDFQSLASALRPPAPGVAFDLRSGAHDFLVIDGVDELHPHDIDPFLDAALAWTKKCNSDAGKVHVVVFGRPEAFGSFYRRHAQEAVLRKPYSLKPPIPLHCLGPQLHNAVLDVFTRYVPTTGFKHTYKGEVPAYHVLTSEDKKMVDATVTVLRSVLRNESVCEATRHLDNINVMVEAAATSVNSTRSKELAERSDAEHQKFFLDAMLNRNSLTHGRPGNSGGAYAGFLGAAAWQAVHSVDTEGYFNVRAGDQVSYNGSSIHLEKLLDFSGIIQHDPIRTNPPRYAFYPRWLIHPLAQEHAERYQYCEKTTLAKLCPRPLQH